jgi:hypothetical protein
MEFPRCEKELSAEPVELSSSTDGSLAGVEGRKLWFDPRPLFWRREWLKVG